ncbi:MAG: S8 family serine peptidase [Haliscomenobacter sp.]|uniref:S8 family peptidase n=1 Tax=Haliscomenobacter sp. TaxID=2717303 RepID=UPI0029AB8996|nr:S8 family serine peptidase [Haliscomenobacter sp.]MDX2067484.1 S8 family serine peptidase [Haliscomenobacter sp.]
MYSIRYGGRDGQLIQLVEAPDLVVVRTQTGKSLSDLNLSDASREAASTLSPVAAFPEADVVVYKILEAKRSLAKTLRNTIRRLFKKEPSIRFAGRVLKDAQTGSIYVYTENFFVKFKDETSQELCETILKEHKLEIAEKLTFATNAYFAKAPEGTGLDIFRIAESLIGLPEMEYCHPELVQEKRYKAIHPMQWHLINTKINGTTIEQNVQAEAAWKISRGLGATIAVIDDGVDIDHLEFNQAGKIVAPRDTIRNTDDPRPRGFGDNHGTACAGVACAAGVGKASGVAPDAKLMPIRSGGLGSMAEAKAFAWAADNGADVISCSWGPADGDWSNPNDPIHKVNAPLPDSARLAIDYALKNGRKGKGCVIVWAAGNGNESVDLDGYAAYAPIIAVAACNDRGKRSVYSDFGKAIWCAFPSNDIFAPNLEPTRPLTPGIWTTDRMGGRGYNVGVSNAENTIGDKEGNYTATFGGTSSACPGVAGVAALMLAANPELTVNQVKNLIKSACDRIDPQGGRYDAGGHSQLYGYGRINALKAVQLAKNSGSTPLVDLNVSGKAYFNRDSSVVLEEGKWTKDAFTNNRLLGLELKVEPESQNFGIQYRLFIQSQGATPFVQNGGFAGTKDARRKVIGFQITLLGPQANLYKVLYSAKLQGKSTIAYGQDGSVCGTSGLTGNAILEIMVEIKKVS